jgi:cysteinyl-tRNA synthetase
LGHARSAIAFDVVFRYLTHLGYKVRYVRNITDVGHLVGDADHGEDKIGKLARLQQLEPMEVAQKYTNDYHKALDALNVLRPSIEPRATGHIPEQIALIEKILANGFAYVSNGSVYMNVNAYRLHYPYGELSGRTELDDQLENTRNTAGQDEKRHPADFALWKRADPEHLMRWDSPWGVGFPGWHIECTAMSTKYLGDFFDIHAGGMDLLFPHHDAEICQSNACQHPHTPEGRRNEARYWLHNNMVTINGQKMGKSLGNFITLREFFEGSHPGLERAYTPMAIRFFMLQAHYGSPLDFSNAALQSAEKAFRRLCQIRTTLQKLTPAPQPLSGTELDAELRTLTDDLYRNLSDDFNTAKAIATLFELGARIHGLHDGHLSIGQVSAETLAHLQRTFEAVFTEVLGLTPEDANQPMELLDKTVQMLITLRQEARARKDFATSDRIRNDLATHGIQLKDGKLGTEWELV